MRNKRWLILLVTAALVMSLIVGCSSTPTTENGGSSSSQPSEKTIELKLADFFPPTHPIPTSLVGAWIEEVEKATNGRVKVTNYPGGTLLGPSDIYGGVVTGIAEAGNTVFSYTPGRFPTIRGFELGGIEYETAKAGSYAVREAIEQLNFDEFKDVKVLLTYNTGPGHLITKTPVTSLEELRGMEIRVSGQTVTTMEALGAIPVAMPMNEAYEALSRGIVQGIVAPVEALEGFKLAEVTDYITIAPFLYSSNFIVAMNLDVWNSLPSDIQEIIDEVNDKIFADVASGFFDMLNESGYKFATEEHGLEVLTLTDAERDRWIQQLQPIIQDYVKEVEQLGLDGQKVIDTIIPLTEKYNEMYPDN